MRPLGALCAAFLSLFAPLLSGFSCAAAQEQPSLAKHDSQSQSTDADQDPKNNGNDLTRPQRAIRNRDASPICATINSFFMN